jgi:uncharacterized protein
MRSKSDDLVLAGAAALLFALLFAFRGAGPLDFWWWMSANVAFLVALSAALDADYLHSVLDDLRRHAVRNILFGVLSAAVLYGVFFAGNRVSLRFLPFAGAGISRVYALKQGTSTAAGAPGFTRGSTSAVLARGNKPRASGEPKARPLTLRVVLLLALLIGPGEELFWRGFLQRRWQIRFGPVRGFLLTAGLYTLVHAATGIVSPNYLIKYHPRDSSILKEPL